jgi:hypothetical protein
MRGCYDQNFDQSKLLTLFKFRTRRKTEERRVSNSSPERADAQTTVIIRNDVLKCDRSKESQVYKIKESTWLIVCEFLTILKDNQKCRVKLIKKSGRTTAYLTRIIK